MSETQKRAVKPTTKGNTEMADNTATAAATPAKTRRKPQGPRKPQPLYVFASVVDGRIQVQKVTKSAHDIAKFVADGGLNSDTQLLTIEAPSGTKTDAE